MDGVNRRESDPLAEEVELQTIEQESGGAMHAMDQCVDWELATGSIAY